MSQSLQVFSHDAFNVTQLFSIIAAILSQRHIGIKPELGAPILVVYVHVTWFVTVV
jgi:hypothetical protein